MSNKQFITIENIVSAILLEIGDETNRQYYVRAFQWALDEYRRLNVHHSPLFAERKLNLETDRYSAPYPDDAVKILSVGIYYNGEFFPFTKKPNLSIYPVDEEDEIFESGDNEGVDIPQRGYGFGQSGQNIGYWSEDPETCLIYVRNYRWDEINQNYLDNTQPLTGKIIVRYKTTGIKCDQDFCMPYEFRELIISMVVYKFMRKGIPVRVTNYNIQLQQQDIEVKKEEFYELTTGVQNFWEAKDAVYASMNMIARR